jgi:hypothetical protein
VNALGAERGVIRLVPESLSPASASLLRGALGGGDESFLEACHQSAGGNPLLLHELARVLADEGIAPDAAHAGCCARSLRRASRERC